MMMKSELLLCLLTLCLSNTSALNCSIGQSLTGRWIQPGLADPLIINETWFSSKGTCINGQENLIGKYLFYNDVSKCKRCIFFIARDRNVLQYRETECFDHDENDHDRVCAGITPDSVLYTLFRDQAQTIPCPIHHRWSFEKPNSACQPVALQSCATQDTFQLIYSNSCSVNSDVIAQCIARFSDGHIQYVVARREHHQEFLCFSFFKLLNNRSIPDELFLSDEKTCRDFLSRDAARAFPIRRIPRPTLDQLPEWIKGNWSTVNQNDENRTIFQLDQTQLIQIVRNNQRTVRYLYKFLRVKQEFPERKIRLRAQSMHQCSSKLFCITLKIRSKSVIDLSIGVDCQVNHVSYTIFRSQTSSNVVCPQSGIYKSFNRLPSLPKPHCTNGGFGTLSIGCETLNKSQLVLSSSCPHGMTSEVQVLTSIVAVCQASWRIDRRFQRTLVVDEMDHAFCLIQSLESKGSSWIVTGDSCSHFNPDFIRIENRFQYVEQCQDSSIDSLFLLNVSKRQQIHSSSVYFVFSICIYVHVMK